MSAAQWAGALLALFVIGMYACRIGAFDLWRGDPPTLGLAHAAGFLAADWVAYSATQAELGPVHFVALLGSALWLLASYPHALARQG